MLHARRPRRARRRARAVLHARRRPSAGAGAATSGRSCRGPSRSCAPRDGRLGFMLEDVGPGTAPPRASSQAGDGLWVDRPAGHRLHRAARTAAARCSRRRRRRPAAGDLAGRAARATASRHASLLGFRDGARTPRAPRCCAQRGVATDDGSLGHHGYVTDCSPPSSTADADAVVYACGPPGDARGGPRAVRGARRAGPARARVRHGLRLRRLLRLRRAAAPPAATPASASTGRSSTPRAARRGPGALMAVSFCGLELAHPVVNGSGTFDAIAARRAFGDALLDAVPVQRLRLQDDHARAARRQPAAAPVGDRRPG